MSTTAKDCIIAWWLLIIVALLLWYRNVTYDRVMAAIFIVLAFLQLINYGCHSAMQPTVAGKLVAILLAVLLVVIMVSVYVYTRSKFGMVLTFASIIIAVAIAVDALILGGEYKAFVTGIDTCPIWLRGESNILGGVATLFLIFVFLAWILMVLNAGLTDIGLYAIGIYALLTMVYAFYNSTVGSMGSCWVYLLSGLVLIVWVFGIFS